MMAATEPKTTALVIEDEAQMRRLIRVILERDGYDVIEAATGNDGIGEAARSHPGVVLLDLGLPDMDGLNVLKRLREWSQAPVLVLSVREHEEDKILALDNGANDYVTKPFAAGELLARMRAAQRSARPEAKSEVFRCGSVSVDMVARLVKVRGRKIKLTATEYSLLLLFIRHAGKALTHGQILREIWGPEEIDKTGYLRVYMARLREKLEDDPNDPQMLVTEPGVGYRLSLPD